MVKKLEELIVKHSSLDSNSPKRVKCTELAKEIIQGWPDSISDVENAASMLCSLQRMGTLAMFDGFLAKLFLETQYFGHYLHNLQLVTKLQATCHVVGWENVSSSIVSLVQRALHSDLNGCCQLLFQFFAEPPKLCQFEQLMK